MTINVYLTVQIELNTLRRCLNTLTLDTEHPREGCLAFIPKRQGEPWHLLEVLHEACLVPVTRAKDHLKILPIFLHLVVRFDELRGEASAWTTLRRDWGGSRKG